ncbi:MAG: hypothetical protein JO297_18495 [Nitrososphaeraceae archaeon]|nr:hypothetical protein [Nitrososphaeraceae archaeon]
MVDSELAISDRNSKSDLLKYLQFKTVDVQNTQYVLGVNGEAINFDTRHINNISVQISLTELPQIAIPALTLLKLRKMDSTNIIIPLDHALGVLNGTLLFTIHFTEPSRGNTTFTIQNDFAVAPIFVLKDSDLVS